MVSTKICGGRALRIAVGISTLVLLITGGGLALSDRNILSQSDINNGFIMHRMDAGVNSDRDLGGRIPENKNLLPIMSIEKAAVMISANAGWYINDNATGGDCISIGTWNFVSKTCTLTTDLTEAIEINSDSITLDGNGHTITGRSSGYGIYISGRSGVTIKNTNVKSFYKGIYLNSSDNNTLSVNNASNNSYGIYLEYSSNNTLSGNNANSNKYDGIDLYSSSNNMLFNNTMTENSINFGLFGWSDSDFNNQIDYTNTVDGKPIYYIINAINTVYDSSTNAGIFYCISCLNVTIGDMELLNNDVGILLWNTTFSKIRNVTVSNNNDGIVLWDSSYNTLSSNNVNSNNNKGIYLLYESNNNSLIGNNASDNSYGIYLTYSSNNMLFYNTMMENQFNFGLFGWTESDFNNQIDYSNTVDGKPIYYVKNAINTVYDSSTNAGTFYCLSCLNVTIKDIELLNNDVGILLWNTTISKIQNVTVSNNNEGIVLLESGNNTLIGNNVNSNDYDGLELYLSTNNTLIGNNASNNYYGIYLTYSSSNILFNNTMTENSFNFGLYGESDSDFNNQIDYSNTVDGKPIYYIKNAINTVYDSSTNAGTIYCISCLNVTIKDIELLKNDVGILLWDTTNSKIQDVTVSNNYEGIVLLESGYNTLIDNNVNSNEGDGIYMDNSSNNMLSGNKVTLSNDHGIHLYSSGNDNIYNNIFNNTDNLYIEKSISIWNIDETPGTNIIGGSFLGGNFWATPSGTGFSQTCADGDSDGICDLPYILDSNNIDNLPLAYSITPSLVDSYLPPGASPEVWKAGLIRAMDDYFAETSLLTKSQLLSIMDAYFS